MAINPEIFWSVLAALAVYGVCKTVLAGIGAFIFNRVTGR